MKKMSMILAVLAAMMIAGGALDVYKRQEQSAPVNFSRKSVELGAAAEEAHAVRFGAGKMCIRDSVYDAWLGDNPGEDDEDMTVALLLDCFMELWHEYL